MHNHQGVMIKRESELQVADNARKRKSLEAGHNITRNKLVTARKRLS